MCVSKEGDVPAESRKLLFFRLDGMLRHPVRKQTTPPEKQATKGENSISRRSKIPKTEIVITEEGIVKVLNIEVVLHSFDPTDCYFISVAILRLEEGSRKYWEHPEAVVTIYC